eukprot:3297710-Prymnesium_polylepis.1
MLLERGREHLPQAVGVAAQHGHLLLSQLLEAARRVLQSDDPRARGAAEISRELLPQGGHERLAVLVLVAAAGGREARGKYRAAGR